MTKIQEYSVAELSEQLKKTRYLKGFSLRELADVCCIHYQTLWNIENQKVKRVHPITYKTLTEFIHGKN